MIPPRVLCVDDNPWIGDSIGQLIRAQPGWEWLGWRDSAAGLVELVGELHPTIIILDVDLPGEDPFSAISQLRSLHPPARVLMLSGHIRADLIDRAVDAGAWGYVSKGDGIDALLRAIRAVASGEVAFSPVVFEEFGHTP